MRVLFFIGGSEVVFILLAILLLFGSKRIPEFAKMFGKGVREFRKATEDIKREINAETKDIKDDLGDIQNNLKP